MKMVISVNSRGYSLLPSNYTFLCHWFIW